MVTYNEWIPLRENGSAKFVIVPRIEEWQRQDIFYSQFSDLNFLKLIASTKKHDRLTALIVNTQVNDDNHKATTRYFFVKEVEKMFYTLNTYGLVDCTYCYPSFGYNSFLVKEGLSELELQDFVLAHTLKLKKQYRGNVSAKEMHLNTAIYSDKELFWYLAKSNFNGEVDIKRIL